jgi:hypothetical protein
MEISFCLSGVIVYISYGRKYSVEGARQDGEENYP